ncbi:MAG: ABC transporter, partial [Acidobacteria bacterium]
MNDPVREQVVALLNSGNAHVAFDNVFKDFPPKLRGVKPKGAPHTAWQLLEHMRIAQW